VGVKKTDPRLVGIGLCIGAAVLFLYAAFSHRWLENTNHKHARVGFSLIAFEVCRDDTCKAQSTFSLVREIRQHMSRRDEPPSGMFAPAGVITMALSLLSIIALGATAYFAYKRQRLTWKVLPTVIALLAIMGALLFGMLFVGKKPGGYGGVGVGPSFWAFSIACVLGIIGSQMLTRLIKPFEPSASNPELPAA
jgi:drug/metabolite transporter (DMT)-like permease